MLFTLKDVALTSQGKTILPPTTLNVESGKHLLLIGPSGCGKTTLLNIMSTLLRASDGAISYEGTDYKTLSDKKLDNLRAYNFGFVFQSMHLIGHLTVQQNIEVAQTQPDVQRIRSLINDLGLNGKEKQKAHNLSGGEAQRVAIARALANTPNVILADEPTSALDDQNTENVMELLFEQAEKSNATLITATHDARIKHRFENVLEMSA